MDKLDITLSVEELFYQHATTKSAASTAIRALKKAYGVDELTVEQILYTDFYSLCRIKGIGRKTILLVAEVACDLCKMK